MLAHAAISPAIHAASIGIPDTLLLMLLALMVFGPRRLPEIGRQIGKLMYEFRKISNDFKFQMEEELRLSEEADRQRQLAAAQAAHTPPPAPVFAAPSAPSESAGTATTETVAADPASETVNVVENSASVDAASAAAQPFTSAVPTIHPPTHGGVVPRAFRGLVPQSAAVHESSSAPESSPAQKSGSALEFSSGLAVQPSAAETASSSLQSPEPHPAQSQPPTAAIGSSEANG